jgi:hypothetical protein
MSVPGQDQKQPAPANDDTSLEARMYVVIRGTKAGKVMTAAEILDAVFLSRLRKT